jgi:hypothetical protein
VDGLAVVATAFVAPFGPGAPVANVTIQGDAEPDSKFHEPVPVQRAMQFPLGLHVEPAGQLPPFVPHETVVHPSDAEPHWRPLHGLGFVGVHAH